MNTINLNSLDKSNWKSYRFDEIAKNISERVDPNNTDLKVYIGLEHLDPDSIHIKRKGTPDEVKGQKLKAYPGDIIFGKRRAYQRKASIITEEAICSAHSFILRANPDVIDPKLFPFFFHSDMFMHRAIDISVGGLSPTINWGTLKEQEFILPAKEQQAELAELLWSMDEVIEKESQALQKYKIYIERFLKDTVSGDRIDSSNWTKHRFGDLGVSFGGLSGKTKKDFGEGFPFITYLNVFNNSRVLTNQVDYVNIFENEQQNQLQFGDILITGSSETPDEVGMSSVLLDNVEAYYLNSFCFGFRLHNFNTLLPEYARFLLRGSEVRKFMYKHAQGSIRFNISKTTIKNKLWLLLPDIYTQKELSVELENNESRLKLFKEKISNSKSLYKSLINEVF